jgi:nickel-dependent lactate racemase
MNIQIAYGKKTLNFDLAGSAAGADVFLPPMFRAAINPLETVKLALDQPLGSFQFSSFAGAKTAAVAINDKTRPVPNHLLLPPLLEKLEQLGLKPENIQFLVATGTHQPLRSEEFELVLPKEILSRYPVLSHDVSQKSEIQFLGTSTRGTPIYINKQFYSADLKIVVGDIEPHHFAGFSGGVKTAVIGLGGSQTINANHAMLVHPEARIANYENNPLRMDIEEIGRRVVVDLAVNAVLNTHKEIVNVFAGSPEAVMQAGIALSRQVSLVPVHGNYDIVIASAGGYPKDINLYQSQKVLTHASRITRDGGVVILVTACIEGVGSTSYEAFMQGKRDAAQVIEAFKAMEFTVGPHKAFQFGRELTRIKVILVSEIDPVVVKSLLLIPAESLAAAYAQAVLLTNAHPRVAIMPYATNTIPSLEA